MSSHINAFSYTDVSAGALASARSSALVVHVTAAELASEDEASRAARAGGPLGVEPRCALAVALRTPLGAAFGVLQVCGIASKL